MSTARLDNPVVQPFVASAINMFSQTFGLEAEAGQPYHMDMLGGHHWDVSGIVGIIGDARGVVVIRLHQALLDALLVHSGLSTTDEDERREILNGMMGEMVNVVGGNGIGELRDYNLDISVPMIVQGQNHQIAWPRIAPVLCVPLRTAAGPCELAISFKGREGEGT